MPVEMFARCATEASVVPGRPASSIERSVASINCARRISRIPTFGIAHSFRPDGPVPGSRKLSGFLLIVQSIKKRGRTVDRVSGDGNRWRRRDCADAEKRIERQLNNFKFV